MGQTATLNMIGIISKVNLDTMVNAALYLSYLLFLECCQ